jgi:hypothetical protein
MTTRYKNKVFDADLKNLLDLLKKDILSSMNCVQIGTIQSYDNIKNTAEVSINFKRKLADGKILSYPLLADCPVYVMTGGSSYISMPITKGDTCLVIFNDRAIDDWWLSNSTLPPSSTRMHSLSDGIVLVGIKSLTSAVLRPLNSVCINAANKKVAIKNNSSDIKTLLNTLVDKMNTLIDKVSAITVIDTGTPAVPAGTWPINPSLVTELAALKTELTTFKTTTINALFDEGTT